MPKEHTYTVHCDKCGKDETVDELHTLPDGWERSMGDDICAECMEPMLKALAALKPQE